MGLINFKFLRKKLGIAEISSKLDRVIEGLTNMDAKFTQDLADLDTAVKANTSAIQQFATLHTQDQASIDSLNKQMADLKAANPALDLSGLEAEIAAIKANNDAATKITASVPPVPSVPAPPTTVGNPPAAGGPPTA